MRFTPIQTKALRGRVAEAARDPAPWTEKYDEPWRPFLSRYGRAETDDDPGAVAYNRLVLQIGAYAHDGWLSRANLDYIFSYLSEAGGKPDAVDVFSPNLDIREFDRECPELEFFLNLAAQCEGGADV